MTGKGKGDGKGDFGDRVKVTRPRVKVEFDALLTIPHCVAGTLQIENATGDKVINAPP